MSKTFAKTYEVLSLLGTGGMSEVYLAQNTKTGIKVAIKILDKKLLRDEDYIKRFKREVEISKTLSHPNIVKIISYGTEKGNYYIVYEHIDGQTLDKYIKSRRLSIKKIENITLQILQGLSHAHSKGIIHRDIKPSNIMISKGGTVKILDFGIARATTKSTITKTGMFIGSPHYTSPEQIDGKKVDVRTDIYSLGIVMYEMVEGRVPFESDTPWGVVRAHLDKPLPRIKRKVPNYIQDVIYRCLEKNPSDRFSSIDEIGNTIRANQPKKQQPKKPEPKKSEPKKPDVVTKIRHLTIPAEVPRKSRFERFWAWNAIILFSVELIVTNYIYFSAYLIVNELATSLNPSVYNLRPLDLIYISLAIGLYIYALGIAEFFITIKGYKTGRKIIGSIDINWLISKSSNVLLVFFSIMFLIRFKSYSLDNYPVLLYPTLSLIILNYYFISSIIYSINILREGKLRIIQGQEKGLSTRKITTIIASPVIVLILIILIILGIDSSSKKDITETIAVEESDENEEFEGSSWEISNDKIAFSSDKGIYIINSDGSGIINISDYVLDFTCSFDGSKIAFTRHDGDSEIYFMDSQGSGIKKVTENNKDEYRPVISPDGEKIAFKSPSLELYIINSDGSDLIRIADTDSIGSKISWSPDSSKIAFLSGVRTERSGSSGFTKVFTANYDGSNITQITEGDSYETQPEWSPDGSKIAFVSKGISGETGWDIHIMNSTGFEESVIADGDLDETQPAWAPDGSKIAFTSNRDGDNEIFVIDINKSNLKQLTKNNIDDRSPVWSPDGLKIVFISTDSYREIFTINPDGSGLEKLTDKPADTEYIYWFNTNIPKSIDMLEEIDSTSEEEDNIREEMSEDSPEAPAISLKIYEGPVYSIQNDIVYYRVEAIITGDPEPNVKFNLADSSGGSLGENKVQINLVNGNSNTLIVEAANSVGKTNESIDLNWISEDLKAEQCAKFVFNNLKNLNYTQHGVFYYYSWIPGYNWSYTIYNENSLEKLDIKYEQVINEVTGLLSSIGIDINKYEEGDSPGIWRRYFFKNYKLSLEIYKNDQDNVIHAVFNIITN